MSVRLIRLFVTRSSGPSSGAVDEHVQLASKYAHRCQFSSCYFNSEQQQQQQRRFYDIVVTCKLSLFLFVFPELHSDDGVNKRRSVGQSSCRRRLKLRHQLLRYLGNARYVAGADFWVCPNWIKFARGENTGLLPSSVTLASCWPETNIFQLFGCSNVIRVVLISCDLFWVFVVTTWFYNSDQLLCAVSSFYSMMPAIFCFRSCLIYWRSPFLKGAENVDPRMRWMRMSTAQALIDIYAALVDVARRITRNPYR